MCVFRLVGEFGGEVESLVVVGVDVDAGEGNFELVGEKHLDHAHFLMEEQLAALLLAPVEVELQHELLGQVAALVVLAVLQLLSQVRVHELGHHSRLFLHPCPPLLLLPLLRPLLHLFLSVFLQADRDAPSPSLRQHQQVPFHLQLRLRHHLPSALVHGLPSGVAHRLPTLRPLASAFVQGRVAVAAFLAGRGRRCEGRGRGYVSRSGSVGRLESVAVFRFFLSNGVFCI